MLVVRLTLGLLLGCCAAALPAHAGCAGKLGLLHASGARIYDPFDATDTVLRYTVSARNIGISACTFAMQWIPSGDPPRLGQIIQYDLAVETPAAVIAPNQETRFTLAARIPRGQLTPPGLYSDLGRVVLTAATDKAPVIAVDQAGAVLPCRVIAIIGINVAGRGTRTTLDFGELQSDASRSVILQTRTNQGYRVWFESANRQRLVRDGSAGDADSAVGYAMSINGVPLVNGVSPAFPVSLADREATHKITVRLGQVAGQLAGLYRDVVRIRLVMDP